MRQRLLRASRQMLAPALLLLGFALGALFEAALIHQLAKRQQTLATRAQAGQQYRPPAKAACPARPHWDPQHGKCDRLTVKLTV